MCRADAGRASAGIPGTGGRAGALARSWRCAAAALLLALAALLALPLQAQAQTEVWSSTLTVRDLGFSLLGCSNSVATSNCSARLTDDDFMHASTDYAVTMIFLRTNGNLEITFDTNLATATQGLILNVDGTDFAFEDADSKPAAGRVWFNSGQSWSAGDSVSLTLIEPASTDATLSDLALEDNNGTTISLTAGPTRTYTASVVESVDEITVLPMVNDSNATYEIQDGDGTALTDADTNTTGFQVAIDKGENTVKVEVTAEDGSTILTYTITVTRDDATPPSPESAEVPNDGTSVTLYFNEDLDVAVQILPTAVVNAFTLTAAGVDLTIDSVWSATTNALSIRLPTGTTIYQNQTVTLSYDKTVAGTDALDDADGNEVASFTDYPATNVSTAVAPGNAAATGKPSITGAAQVEMTLEAGLGDIADADDLPASGYTYQWTRGGSDIAGATGTSYTLSSADYGQKLRVRVSFTDGAGFLESRTSDETLPVAPTAAACPGPGGPAVWCATLTVGHRLEEEDGFIDVDAAGYEARSGRTAFGSVTGGATFRHLGVDYTVTALVGVSHEDLLLATTPNLPADGAGLTVHVQTYGGEVDASLAEGEFFTHTNSWSFLDLLLSSPTDPLADTPLIRGVYTRFARILEPTDLGTRVRVRLSYAAPTGPATGVPEITGTIEVGETLTADTSRIADGDGLTRSYVRKLVTELSGGVFGYLDSVLERHSFDEFGELI